MNHKADASSKALSQAMKCGEGLTVCDDARHLGGSKLCGLLALVPIKHAHQAAADLVLTPIPWLEVW